jgi:hypothetical protein
MHKVEPLHGAKTFSRVASATVSGLLIVLDTVPKETPAALAMATCPTDPFCRVILVLLMSGNCQPYDLAPHNCLSLRECESSE